jgi:hypothetical protein
MFMCMRSYINAMKLAEPLRPRPLVGQDFQEEGEEEGGAKHEPLDKRKFLEFMECESVYVPVM